MITIPSYPNPFDPSTPLANAVAKIASISLSVSEGSGSLVLNIYPNTAAVGAAPPIATLRIALGQGLAAGNQTTDPPIPPVYFPTFAQLMEDSAFASAYQTVGARLYADLVATVPLLAGATIGSDA